MRVDHSGYECDSLKELRYDEKGRVFMEIIHGHINEDEYYAETRFEYTSFDAKGNWTRRVAKTTATSYEGVKESTLTETRQIEYYE